MNDDLDKLAEDIIKQNQYISISSVDNKGIPWISPVVYSYDQDWNLYFVSIPNSRHSQNIKENNQVALAIFDSHQLLGEGVGLQIEGIAKELSITEIPAAAAIYFNRQYPFGKMKHSFNEALKKFLEKKLYKFYKITPTKIWMNNPNSAVDERVEISF